jgi:arylformamidase
MSGWIDISVDITPGLTVWKGDGAPVVEQTMFIEKGDPYNLTRLAFSAHTGTHMDAPRHFIRNGAGMEALPLDAVMGPARVIEILDPVAVRAAEIPRGIEPGARVLFKTMNSSRNWAAEPFREDFVFIARDAAQLLVDLRVRTVGIDYLSVGGFSQDLVETHEILLGAGIWIIEGIHLVHVKPGPYELACLPLRIPGADGAPARAALRPL